MTTHSEPGLTGRQVWQKLMDGNMRFVQGYFRGRDLLDLRRSLAQGQKPEAAILCCSDSRVPAEIIFDQSLGDLFVVRTAGLVLDPTSIGSLEYAVAHLHVPLLVIKGHEGCGAVTAAVEHPEAAHDHICAIVDQIVPAAVQARQTGKNGHDLIEATTDIHLKSLEETLFRVSPIIRAAVDRGRLEIIVAKYYLDAGQVQPLASTF
ncbi:MAG: carbonic anhydrase [Syntrophobacterales bacterium]|jgi:carbonic anhydrase|nr:carbonic anhydrase [Syntrophobacterales bacterium]